MPGFPRRAAPGGGGAIAPQPTFGGEPWGQGWKLITLNPIRPWRCKQSTEKAKLKLKKKKLRFTARTKKNNAPERRTRPPFPVVTSSEKHPTSNCTQTENQKR